MVVKATFSNHQDAAFANHGPHNADLAIRAVDGADAAFLLVRIVMNRR